MAVSGARKLALGLSALEIESICLRLRERHGLHVILRPIFQIGIRLRDVMTKVCVP